MFYIKKLFAEITNSIDESVAYLGTKGRRGDDSFSGVLAFLGNYQVIYALKPPFNKIMHNHNQYF